MGLTHNAHSVTFHVKVVKIQQIFVFLVIYLNLEFKTKIMYVFVKIATTMMVMEMNYV